MMVEGAGLCSAFAPSLGRMDDLSDVGVAVTVGLSIEGAIDVLAAPAVILFCRDSPSSDGNGGYYSAEVQSDGYWEIDALSSDAQATFTTGYADEVLDDRDSFGVGDPMRMRFDCRDLRDGSVELTLSIDDTVVDSAVDREARLGCGSTGFDVRNDSDEVVVLAHFTDFTLYGPSGFGLADRE